MLKIQSDSCYDDGKLMKYENYWGYWLKIQHPLPKMKIDENWNDFDEMLDDSLSTIEKPKLNQYNIVKYSNNQI